MKAKLRAALAAAACLLAFGVGAVRADTVFDLSGTFTMGNGGTLGGTITINTDAPGSVTGLHAVYSFPVGGNQITFTRVFFSVAFPGFWEVSAVDPTSGSSMDMFFTTPPVVAPNPATLVGFNGGQLVAGDVLCVPECNPFAAGLTGSITFVPGPIVGAGLPGLALAAVGMVGFARRRQQKAV